MSLNINRLRRIKEIREEKAGLAADLKYLNEELRSLEVEAFNEMMSLGVHSVVVDGKSCYLHRELRPSPVNPEALYEALQLEGFGDIVKRNVHASTLKAFLMDISRKIESETGLRPTPDEILNDLPVSVRENINIFEQISVRTRSRS
jgi:hypothetical protein